MDPPCLQIRLLGELDLQLGGTPLPPLEPPRARSLLAYLLLHRDAPQPRQRLAFLLWPQSAEAQARTNLRHLLHTLRSAAPALAPCLEVSAGTLRWRPDASCWLDVAALEDALARGEREGDDPVRALREAADLYRGDLLEGCYDEWIESERARLRQRYLHSLERLVDLLAMRGEHAAAIRYAERLLGHDPFHEKISRLLMRLHRQRGDRARALRVYHEHAATLARELGVEPSRETREAYEALLARGDDPERKDALAGRAGRPPLVGRAAEWDRLTSLWRTTERGRTQLVLVSGEAGIGKTRLVEELSAWCSHRGAVAAEARSYRAEGALAYGVVSAWLRSEALEPQLARVDRATLTEIARLLPDLPSRIPDLPHPEPLPADDQRARLFTAVSRVILGVGVPVLLIADDLQWCDQESLRLIHHLLRAQPEARLMVAATARHEELCDPEALDALLLGLRMLDHVTEIELARLGAEETATLAERLTGRPLATPDGERLHAETEGNPLFVVEALRAGWRGGDREGPWVSPKVQAVIQHRLGQLSEAARHLADLAATAGREFGSDVLERAAELPGETFVRALDELWRRGIIREHGVHGYDFSHDKIREAVYSSLGRAQRRRHHLRVAHALAKIHVSDPGPVSAQIAAHYERAGEADQAITWYETAAETAQKLYAHSETIRLLGRALDLLRARPASVEGTVRELAILTALLTPVSSADGWASTRLAEVQRRALELSGSLRVEPSPQLLYSLALASLSRDEFEAARSYGERLRTRSLTDADDAVLVESDYVLGIAAFWQGELEVARTHFEAAVSGYRPDRSRSHLLHFWLDPRVVCLSRLGNTLLLLGEPDAAIRARDAALALADEIGHPFSRTTALVFAAYLAIEMDDVERLRRYVGALHAACGDYELQVMRVSDEILRAYLRVLDGEAGTGIAAIRGMLEDPAGAGHAPGMRAMVARLLLAACTAARDLRGRLAAAEELLRIGGAARLWEAEAHRARAECLAELGSPAEAIESELRSALETARRQGARLFERRAAASLLRFREERGGGSDPSAAPETASPAAERSRERFGNGRSVPSEPGALDGCGGPPIWSSVQTPRPARRSEMSTAYDVIIVGARCAGSATAMLLARRGYHVLLVDRATFPSDTLSTHIIQPRGVAALARWGLLERLVATGCPPIHSVSFDFGGLEITGSPGTPEAPVAYCPRRTVLDKLLIDAAAEAGAEVREGFTVEEVVFEDGRVVGIRGRGGWGSTLERAPVVVGADGWHSFVARSVRAPRYHERPPLSAAYYAYWSDLPVDGRVEVHLRPHRGFGAAPTHDGLTMTIGGWPFAEFDERRRDVEGSFMELLTLVPEFGDRVRGARRESRIFGAAIPNYFHQAYGPGWVLVGDAGYIKDSITAQGISDAFADAERCAHALDESFSGVRPFDDAMRAFQSARDEHALPMFELTCQVATLEPPPPEMQRILASIQGDRTAMDRFVQMNAGTISPAEFFSATVGGAEARAAPGGDGEPVSAMARNL